MFGYSFKEKSKTSYVCLLLYISMQQVRP